MSIANASPGNIGFAYSAPDHGAEPDAPVTRLGLLLRIVASAVLAVIGVNAVVQIVRMLAQAEPVWVGALEMTVVVVLTLDYPFVNLVRWGATGRPPPSRARSNSAMRMSEGIEDHVNF